MNSTCSPFSLSSLFFSNISHPVSFYPEVEDLLEGFNLELRFQLNGGPVNFFFYFFLVSRWR